MPGLLSLQVCSISSSYPSWDNLPFFSAADSTPTPMGLPRMIASPTLAPPFCEQAMTSQESSRDEPRFSGGAAAAAAVFTHLFDVAWLDHADGYKTVDCLKTVDGVPPCYRDPRLAAHALPPLEDLGNVSLWQAADGHAHDRQGKDWRSSHCVDVWVGGLSLRKRVSAVRWKASAEDLLARR